MRIFWGMAKTFIKYQLQIATTIEFGSGSGVFILLPNRGMLYVFEVNKKLY